MKKLLAAVLFLVIPLLGYSETGLFSEKEFVIRLNRYRETLGLTTLPTDPGLSVLAVAYADICKAHGRLDHHFEYSEEYLEAVEGIKKSYDVVAELLQMTYSASSADALDAWLASPSHKEALLRPDAVAVGIGASWSPVLYLVVYVGR